MPVSTIRRIRVSPYYMLGVLLILLGWQLLSMRYHKVLIPSPLDTLRALAFLYESGELKTNLTVSFYRWAWGLSLGVIAGLVSGLTAGGFRKWELLAQPLINLLLAVPAIVFVVMALVWFGMGTKMTIFLVASMVFPVMHTNTAEAFKSLDPALLQMTKVYRMPFHLIITRVYFPGMLNGLIAGLSLALASSVRLTVMAELIGAREGMGQRIAVARAYLETDLLFAWVVVLLTILFCIEFLVIRRWSGRWAVK